MPGPCPFGLASIRVPGKRWRTRVERLEVLDRVRQRIQAGTGDDLSALGYEAGISPYHLQRLFTTAFGESPKAMADRIRATRAAEMLRQGAKLIEVVVSLRYSEASAFSRDFKRFHALYPDRAHPDAPIKELEKALSLLEEEKQIKQSSNTVQRYYKNAMQHV